MTSDRVSNLDIWAIGGEFNSFQVLHNFDMQEWRTQAFPKSIRAKWT